MADVFCLGPRPLPEPPPRRGALVYVRGGGRARTGLAQVVEDPAHVADGEKVGEDDAVLVQCREGSLPPFAAPLRKLTRLYGLPPSRAACCICAETSCYRSLARSQLVPDDIVVELGCSFGVATALLAARARRCVGVDVAADALECARARCSASASGGARGGGAHAVRFLHADVVSQPQLAVELCDEERATVAFVDLGGNRAGGPLMPLLQRLRTAPRAPLRLIVVKSRDLHDLARETALTCAAASDSDSQIGDSVSDPASGGAAPADGPSPMAEAGSLPNPDRFWLEARDAARDGPGACWPSPPVTPPDRKEWEDRPLCFGYLNLGRCKRGAACIFRHVPPEHPDALADAKRRREEGAWSGGGRRGVRAGVGPG